MKTKLQKLNLLRMFRLEGVEKKLTYLAAIALVVAANLALTFAPVRLDLSSGRAYTLSDSTKRVLRALDKPVAITFFVSRNLPTRATPFKNDVVDLLSEYKQAGRGKIALKTVDPKSSQNSQQEAQGFGIPEIQFSQLEQDKYAVSTGYFGIGISYQDKKDSLPQVADLSDLEYNITSAIYKLARADAVKIGIIGNEFTQVPDQLQAVRGLLSRQFEVEQVQEPGSQNAILVVDNNTKTYTPQEVASLKEYIKKGGKVVLFADGVWVAEALTAASAEHGLFGLLRDFGITLNKDLVLSTSAELVNFGGGDFQLVAPYPFWVKTNQFNPESSYFSNITSLTFPWVSSISVSKKEGIETADLIKTTPRSWRQDKSFILDPQAVGEPNERELKPRTVGVGAKLKNGGELVVIASSRFVRDQFISRGSGNLGAVLNIMNEAASGGALSGIRARAVEFYPLPDLPNQQKDLFKYLNILALPLLFGVYGAARLLRRR